MGAIKHRELIVTRYEEGKEGVGRGEVGGWRMKMVNWTGDSEGCFDQDGEMKRCVILVEGRGGQAISVLGTIVRTCGWLLCTLDMVRCSHSRISHVLRDWGRQCHLLS